MQPYPVVTQPDKNFEQASFVFVLDGASVHANALQVSDPIALSIMHNPSDPIRPSQPYFYIYVLQGCKNKTHPPPYVKHPFKKLSQAVFVV